MSDDPNTPNADQNEQEPQPVAVPPPVPAEGEDSEPQPVAVPVPAPPADPIALVEDFDEAAPTKRKAFGAGAGSNQHKEDFKRDVNLDGTGATRCRLFTSKISLGSLTHMEEMVNEWLDGENIEIKHVGHVIGTMEGKRAEDNLMVLVWY